MTNRHLLCTAWGHVSWHGFLLKNNRQGVGYLVKSINMGTPKQMLPNHKNDWNCVPRCIISLHENVTKGVAKIKKCYMYTN